MILLFLKGAIKVRGYERNGVHVSAHIRQADAFAEKAHAGMYRKGMPNAPKIPYIEHPRSVLNILQNEAGITDVVTLQAALLHDTIEDTGTKHQHLTDQFGKDVADVVQELTNPEDFGPGGKAAWQAEHAKKMSKRAADIKIADKTSNLRDILTNPPDWPAERKRKYFEDAKKVVYSMGSKNRKLLEIFDQTYLLGMKTL